MSRIVKQRLKRTGGFSFIEIFVILIILSIAAAAAIPSYKNVFESLRLKQSAEDMVHYLHYGRTRALIRQNSLRLAVDASEGTFWLEEWGQKDGGEVDFVALQDRWGEVYRIPSDFELRTDAAVVDLFRDGRMSKAVVCLCSKEECLSVRTGIILGRAYVDPECESE